MSLPRDRYYWAQLRLALTSGQWSSKHPAKALNGNALSWSELFRKFNKHCRGFQDVAQVASQTHALALLLGANSRDDDQDGDGEGIYPLELGEECVLLEERIEEAKVGYEVLKGLKSSNFDVCAAFCPRTTDLTGIDTKFRASILCLCPGQSD